MARKAHILLAAAVAMLFAACHKDAAVNTATINSFDDLKGHTVATLMGSTYDIHINDNLEDIECVTFQSKSEVIAAVANGKAEYMVTDATEILSLDLEATGLDTVGFIDDLASPIAGAVQKGSPRAAEIKACFDAFVHKMKADSTYEKILARWGTPHPDTVELPAIDLPQEGPEVVVGCMNDNMPFCFIRDGETVGADIEMLMRWSEASGYVVRYEYLPFSSLLAAVQTGKIDLIISTLSVTEERAKSVDFTESYYYCGAAVVRKAAIQESKTFGQWLRDGIQNNLVAEGRWKMILQGLWETLVISFWSLVIGTLLGCGVCALRMKKNKVWQGVAKGYINLMRGVPILVLLMILFYLVFADSGVTGRWVAIIAFSLNFAAYVSEMFRNGIESVDKGQCEAGWAMGFTKAKTFFLIVVPQSLRRIVPVYKGEAVSLVKSTSIVGYIAIQDLTKVSDIIRSRTFDAFFPLLVITIIYLVLAWLLGVLIDHIKIR